MTTNKRGKMHSQEFKDKLVEELVNDPTATSSSIGAKYGVSHNLVAAWRRYKYGKLNRQQLGQNMKKTRYAGKNITVAHGFSPVTETPKVQVTLKPSNGELERLRAEITHLKSLLSFYLKD